MLGFHCASAGAFHRPFGHRDWTLVTLFNIEPELEGIAVLPTANPSTFRFLLVSDGGYGFELRERD